MSPDLDTAYATIKPLVVYTAEDGSLNLKEPWPEITAFGPKAIEFSKPEIVRISGLIRITLRPDGTTANGGKAIYRILGIKYGNIVCSRIAPPEAER